MRCKGEGCTANSRPGASNLAFGLFFPATFGLLYFWGIFEWVFLEYFFFEELGSSRMRISSSIINGWNAFQRGERSVLPPNAWDCLAFISSRSFSFFVTKTAGLGFKLWVLLILSTLGNLVVCFFECWPWFLINVKFVICHKHRIHGCKNKRLFYYYFQESIFIITLHIVLHT